MYVGYSLQISFLGRFFGVEGEGEEKAEWYNDTSKHWGYGCSQFSLRYES